MTDTAGMRGVSERTRIALVLVGAVSGIACSSGPWKRDETWSFALTQGIWEAWEEQDLRRFEDAEWHEHDSGAAYVAIVIVCLPIVLDLVLLPVTIPHDLSVD